ncbi:MAG: teichoic acid transporter [Eggerthellaceae bacterium]|nr:teichoic acid transporter [Eggerthellaceae bacterium]
MEAKHSKSSAGRHSGAHAGGHAAGEPVDPTTSRAQEGSVRYLEGEGLKRPLDPPELVRRGMLVFMGLAVLVGAFLVFRWVDGVYLSPASDQEEMQRNITREVALDLPSLATLMPLDDAAMVQSFADAGLTIYERTPVGTNPDGGFDVVKLPSDVSLEEAGLLYLQGINNISGASAAKLLNGSWDLEVSRKAGTVLRLHYADFSATNADDAIFNAMASQGLDSTMVTDSGVDDAGNTYQAGTTPEGYGWRVSVIGLDEMYKISGLPSTAQYVGIRMTD